MLIATFSMIFKHCGSVRVRHSVISFAAKYRQLQAKVNTTRYATPKIQCKFVDVLLRFLRTRSSCYAFFPRKKKLQGSLASLSTQFLKITEKVSFNIASEASYVYRVEKFLKNAKNSQFWRVFENLKLAVIQCYYLKLLVW